MGLGPNPRPSFAQRNTTSLNPQLSLQVYEAGLLNRRVKVIPHPCNLGSDRGERDNCAQDDQAANQTPLQGFGSSFVPEKTNKNAHHTPFFFNSATPATSTVV